MSFSSSPAKVIGLDIGGANLKASDGETWSQSQPFPLWKEPQRLSSALLKLLSSAPEPRILAVTMTGELADCFASKAEGVNHILSAVESVIAAWTHPLSCAVWQTSGEFVSIDEARDEPRLTAAANWHALATWVGRLAPQSAALLIDIGSTTTDIIPIENGLPVPEGLTDTERLLSGELVYTGSRRTPLAAVASRVVFRGASCPVASELFATSLDVALLLEMREEDPTDCDTADGRPATKVAAYHRLVRMLCADTTEITEAEALSLARSFASAQLSTLTIALKQVLSRLRQPLAAIVLSGEGESRAGQLVGAAMSEGLANHIAAIECLSLTQLLGPQQSQAACAFALSRLAQERWLF